MTSIAKMKAGIVGAIALVGLAVVWMIEHRAQTELLEANRSLLEQIDQLTAGNQRLSNQIPQASSARSLPNAEFQEVLRLRGEVTRLQGDSEELAQLKAAAQKRDPAYHASLLKQRLEEMPEKKIPELQFLTDRAWQFAATDGLESDGDFRYAFSRLREEAKKLFVQWLGQALHNYAKANGGFLPTDLSQLKPYFTPPAADTNGKRYDPPRYELLPVDDAILQRYQLVQTGKLSDVPQVGTYPPGTGDPETDTVQQKNKTNLPWTEPVVVEKDPVDDQYDSIFTITVYGYSYKNFGRGTGVGSGTFAKGKVGPDGVPELVDPPPAVGRR